MVMKVTDGNGSDNENNDGSGDDSIYKLGVEQTTVSKSVYKLFLAFSPRSAVAEQIYDQWCSNGGYSFFYSIIVHIMYPYPVCPSFSFLKLVGFKKYKGHLVAVFNRSSDCIQAPHWLTKSR